MVKKIAILGAGFIGKNLLNSYAGSGHLLHVLDRNSPYDKLPDGIEWIEGSFGEPDAVRHAITGADVVFHLISSTVPGDAVDENEEIMNNVVQTISLLKLCLREHVGRVVFISSASVYGIKRNLPVHESASTDPISSHGIHKLTIEKYLKLYKYQYGLDCKIMRLANPYGGGQNIFGRQGFIAIAIGKLLTGASVIVHGDGSAIRDFIHIDDVIKACHLLAESNSDEDVFNIGSGKGISINDVLGELRQLTDIAMDVTYVRNRKNDIAASILDIQKAKGILGFEPCIPLKEGLKLTISSYAKDFPERVKFKCG
ncbi:MAG: NAD-dependent epimerase/dehydratase family protein [Nitrospirae bacterium]|nr:NAD-dependent epimerase/dehydratase family protein [Nitrospirota bacterium]